MLHGVSGLGAKRLHRIDTLLLQHHLQGGNGGAQFMADNCKQTRLSISCLLSFSKLLFLCIDIEEYSDYLRCTRCVTVHNTRSSDPAIGSATQANAVLLVFDCDTALQLSELLTHSLVIFGVVLLCKLQ